MATGTLRLAYFYLDDRWPGAVNWNRSIPTDGWNNAVDNITTTVSGQTPPVPVGTKVSAYSNNPHAPGYYTMMYLMFHTWSSSIDSINATDFSLQGAWCAHCDESDAEKYTEDASAVPYYVVAKCYTASSCDLTEVGNPIALPCFTLQGDGSGVFVAGYGDCYGWFWVGGVCPLNDVSHFRGAADNTRGFDFSTDSNLRSGPAYFAWDTTSAQLTSCDIEEIQGDDASGGGLLFPHGFTCTSSSV